MAQRAVAIATGDAQTTHSYTDASVEPGQTYNYELVIRTGGGDEYRSPVASATIARVGVALSQNFPNPFNPRTTIAYKLTTKAVVSIEIFNVSGALVRRLEEGSRKAGRHQTEWDGRDTAGRAVASGIYFYRLAGVVGADSRKMVLLK